MIKKFAMITFVIICCHCSPVSAEPQAVQFDLGNVYPDLGIDSVLDWDAVSRPAYPEIDEAVYGVSAGKYLLQDFVITLRGGNNFRVMLTCSSFDRNYAGLGIQLLIADERETPAVIFQSVRLGDGYAPEIITVPEDADNIMFRVIRAGDNTEAIVYEINPVLGLDEKVAITRRFPESMNLRITCMMTSDGIMEAASEQPYIRRMIDMSDALDALIEDELYQPDGNPVRALENLRLIRGGWEDENLYHEDGEIGIDVGMSLMSLSQKPVVDVTAVLRRDADGEWVVSGFRFEPALPYK